MQDLVQAKDEFTTVEPATKISKTDEPGEIVKPEEPASEEALPMSSLDEHIAADDINYDALKDLMQRYTQVELHTMLCPICEVQANFIQENAADKDEAITWILKALPDDVKKSFSLQIQVFAIPQHSSSALSGVWAGSSSASSGSAGQAANFGGPAGVAAEFAEGSPLRTRMLRAFQYNLLSEPAKDELATQLGAHSLVAVPAKLIQKVDEYLPRLQPRYPGVVPCWLNDELEGGDKVLSLTGSYMLAQVGDAFDFHNVVRCYIKNNGGYRPPQIWYEDQ